MKHVIQPNRHRSFPPPFGIYFNRRSFRRSVVFTPSCRYHLEGVDYFDVNKLFGVGFFPHHHGESARFGWRYDEANDKISLYAYAYVGGEKVIKHITCVPIGREVELELYIEQRRRYWFGVKQPQNPFYTAASYSIPFSHKKKWQYLLGPYFGGNRRAPQRIEIHLKNLKS